MRRSKVGLQQRLVVGFVLVFGAVNSASAIYLDEERNISFRARIYSQASIRLSDSHGETTPVTKAGQLVQHRNFYNPELDANLTSYMGWMQSVGLSWLQPDDFSFRVAGWGFYDGIYDYGSSQFNDTQREINKTWPNPNLQTAFQITTKSFRCPERRGAFNECIDPGPGGPAFRSIKQIFPGSEAQRPRDVYASDERVNELYLSYTKGPFFLRLGRQAISWGEADTIALLDQNNPFDITAGPPGAFQDLSEARIPLWTVRTSLSLFDHLGPFSSGFFEAYWVPGVIDNNTGTLPILTASPYSPAREDPQETIRSLGLAVPIQFVLADHLPNNSMKNSRYGFRFQTVIAREHTFSIWYYRAFPSQPVPVSRGLQRFQGMDATGAPATIRLFTTETIHKLTSVYGVADSFFIEPLDSILRFEAEYFENEPGFVAEINLGAGTVEDPLQFLAYQGQVPVADILRWEVGLDRFFFLRALNPTNSFTWVTAVVGAYNLDETDAKDFRFAGQTKADTLGDEADHFVQLKQVEAFAQTHLETSYMHGRLAPAITLIANVRGTHSVLPEITYRYSDSLLFSLKFVYIGGEYQQLGFFRDRDQVSFRVTYQLN
jgi:hypothetical protein